MSELKKYLDPMSSSQRILFTIIITFLVLMVIFFVYTGISSGFALGLMFLPLGIFLAFGAFVCSMLLKTRRAYDNWWNSLSDAERKDIKEDFRQARQFSYYLLAGPRYAYIRNTGRALPFEKIDHIEFIPGRYAHCYMHIYLLDEKMVFVDMPSFADAEQLEDDLLNACA